MEFTVEDGKLTGEVTGPLVSGSKLDVLNGLVEEAGITLDEVVAVGDGANDISMIESAGCGIAFNAKDSVKEIADILKISETAVQTRLQRARQKLKKVLGGDEL